LFEEVLRGVEDVAAGVGGLGAPAGRVILSFLDILAIR
jgi:hypothetical protein